MVSCFGSCFGRNVSSRSSAQHARDDKPSQAALASAPDTAPDCKADSQGAACTSKEACSPVPHLRAPQLAPTTVAPAPVPTSAALSSIQDPPPGQAVAAPQPACGSASSKGSKENSEDGTTTTSSSSSSDCISMDYGSSSGCNAAAQVGQYITQFDSLSQLLGIQEQVKDEGDMQIPGTLLLVVLELFLKLDAKSAEAAVHSLDPPDDTGMDCIYEAFRTGMSELCSMPTPPGSCSENPLPGLAAPPPPPPALQQDHQPQQQTQTLGQLHSSGATTTRIMRHAGGRVGHLAGVFSLDVQAQTAGSVPANGAAHTTSAALAAAAVGSCSADTQSKSNGSGSKGKEDSPPGLFEQQSQGAQQHNIEIWERFSQVRTSQRQAMQQHTSQQLSKVSSCFPPGMSPKASGLHRKRLPALGSESSLPRPLDQTFARASMKLSPEKGPYLSAVTTPVSGASDSSLPPLPIQHHNSAATTANLSSSTSQPIAPHSPAAELSLHSPPTSQYLPVRPRTNLLVEPRHLPYGREGPPWPGDCAWCRKHAAQQLQQQHKRHGSMNNAPLLRAHDRSDDVTQQQRLSQQGGLRPCLVHAQPDPLAPRTSLMNHAQGGGQMTSIPPLQPQQPLPDAHAHHHRAHSTSSGAGLSKSAALPHLQLHVHRQDSPAAAARSPSLKHVQFSSATTSHWFQSPKQPDALSSQHAPASPPPRSSSITQPQLSTQQQQAPQAPLQPSLQHTCAAPALRHHYIARSSPQLAMDAACVEAAQAHEPLGLSAPCLWRWWWWWGMADFELTGHLHSGKSSEVVQGTCKRSGTPCVIKAYSLLHMSESERVHLHREITFQRRLDHPSITQLYCAFVEQGMFASGSDARFTHLSLVLEHAPGGNLAKYLKERGGQLPEAEAVELVMRPLLTALQYIHEQGIVHRDIKPENLLLDADKRLKIADFGLAVDADAGQNTFAGTLSYMSPELYSVMPKALNRSATTVSRLKHTVTATDLESSKSSEGCPQEASGEGSKLSPVPSPHVSSAHASSAAPGSTQEVAGRLSSACLCGDSAGEAADGPREPARAKPCAQEKTSSNLRSLSRRRHSDGSESVRTSHTSRTSHASKASRASRASRRSMDTVRSLLQQHNALIPEVQEQGPNGTATTTAAAAPAIRGASLPSALATPAGIAQAQGGSGSPNSGAGMASVASSPPFNAAAAAAAAAARCPMPQHASAGASRFAFGSSSLLNQLSGAASLQQQQQQQHRTHAGKSHGTWMASTPSFSPAPSSPSTHSSEEKWQQRKPQPLASMDPLECGTCPSSPPAQDLPTELQQQASTGANGSSDRLLQAPRSSPAVPAATGASAAGASPGASTAAPAPGTSAAGTAWRRPVPRQASAGASRFAAGAAATSVSTPTPSPAPAAVSGVSRRPGVQRQASSNAASKVWASPFGTAIIQRSSRGTGGDVAALAGWEEKAGAAGTEGCSPHATAAAAAGGSPRPRSPPLQQSLCLSLEEASAEGLPGTSGVSPPSTGAGVSLPSSPHGSPSPGAQHHGTDLRMLAQEQRAAATAGERGSLATPPAHAWSPEAGAPAGGAAAAAAAGKFAGNPQGHNWQPRLPAAFPHSRSAGQVLDSEGYHQANGGGSRIHGAEQESSSHRGGRAGRYSWEAVEGEEAAHGLGVRSRPSSAAQLDNLAVKRGSTYQRTDTQGSQRSKGSAQQGLRSEGPGGGGLGSRGSLGLNSMLSLSDEESKQSTGTESRANTGGLPCSTSIDVWAVGVLTYVLLVGRHPFKRGSMQEIRNAVLAFKGRSSLDLPAHLSAEAASFITTCLHTSPLNRPPVVELLNHAWIKREKVAGSSSENA